MKYDFLVFIGRFQPFHRGHLDVIEQALEQTERLIIIIGSHDRPCEYKNPFDSVDRTNIIKQALTADQRSRISFSIQVDHTYNEEKWLASIQALVTTEEMRNWRAGPIKTGIIGYNKDHSSFYLKNFPQWQTVNYVPKQPVLHATDLRNILFSELSYEERLKAAKPYMINQDHEDRIFWHTKFCYDQMRYEHRFLNKYRQDWGTGPFITADALVTQAGHLLVIERGSEYGGGLWALPGGFVNPKETFREAVLRELTEETDIDVPKPVLNGSIGSERIFDSPDRSARGRIITMCSHFKLNDQYSLPKVKGSDDATNAFWITLSEFRTSRHKWFEDHYDLISAMLEL
jgi:bifunctional NMN adenylyltransferase/nudix hydrolase